MDRCRWLRQGQGRQFTRQAGGRLRSRAVALCSACRGIAGRTASLQLAQGGACDRRHLVDGAGCCTCRGCLSTTATRRPESELIRDVQGHGSSGCSAIIITPAMIATWVLGLWLAWQGGYFSSGWFHAKFALVFALSGGSWFLLGVGPPVRPGPEYGFGLALAALERGPDRPHDLHRYPRDRETVLKILRFAGNAFAQQIRLL